MNELRVEKSCDARTYKSLKTMLVEYRFSPGTQLPVKELSDHLRVSLTPVREALMRLRAEALLDSSRQRGFFVRPIDLREMMELSEFTFVMLKHAIETSAKFCGLAQSKVSSVISQQAIPLNGSEERQDQTPSQHAHYIEEAYWNVACISDSDVIIDAIRNANDRTHYIRAIDLERGDRRLVVGGGIEELFEALHGGSSEAAIAALRRQLGFQLEALPAAVNEGISRSYILHAHDAKEALGDGCRGRLVSPLRSRNGSAISRYLR
jgi:GntR family transcriptional regulator, rspAB operon transcriptional repressor